MKLKKYRVLAAALCAAFLLCGITTTAYAGGGEEWEDGTGGPEWEGLDPVEPPATPEPEPEPNPFTPDGQGTMVDNATDQDGKEFFTIMAADESVFYLVIDRQRETENVYFLNAVTVADLMALAEPYPNRSRSRSLLPPRSRNRNPSRKNPEGRGRSCWC
ncbi:CD1107 family mobile element protein [Acutalibacter sp. 1XD8-36]|uniref:CD1107 family mobile element protein n=1 Tax=Acutalibacter sp. 1XD8-36 TaxID=2320852 RepID=UPI003FA45AF1